ncbi:MAG: AzlC family ABC transporter permease [Simkaniaceae bacterium]|nr:AzlC family ABC transporter permease [Simkaniaceae bacterium]
MNKKKLITQAFIDSLPILAAYFPLGLVWGVLWTQAGLPPLWGIAYSLCIYAGAVQFIALAALTSGTSIAALLISVVPVALRNCFYTTTALSRLPEKWLLRLHAAFGLVDANFAIIQSKPEELARNPWYHLSLTICVQIYWVGGTAIGIFSGSHLPAGINTLDFALPALLAVLALGQVQKAGYKSAAVAALAAGIAYLIAGSSWMIPALVLSTVAALPRRAHA